MSVERFEDPDPGEPLEEAVRRLREAMAVLEAIDAGDMLAELPADPRAREDHQRAVSLLAVLHRDLLALAQQIEAAACAQGMMGRAFRPDKAANPGRPR